MYVGCAESIALVNVWTTSTNTRTPSPVPFCEPELEQQRTLPVLSIPLAVAITFPQDFTPGGLSRPTERQRVLIRRLG
jgi:hypothetical protein